MRSASSVRRPVARVELAQRSQVGGDLLVARRPDRRDPADERAGALGPLEDELGPPVVEREAHALQVPDPARGRPSVLCRSRLPNDDCQPCRSASPWRDLAARLGPSADEPWRGRPGPRDRSSRVGDGRVLARRDAGHPLGRRRRGPPGGARAVRRSGAGRPRRRSPSCSQSGRPARRPEPARGRAHAGARSTPRWPQRPPPRSAHARGAVRREPPAPRARATTRASAGSSRSRVRARTSARTRPGSCAAAGARRRRRRVAGRAAASRGRAGREEHLRAVLLALTPG